MSRPPSDAELLRRWYPTMPHPEPGAAPAPATPTEAPRLDPSAPAGLRSPRGQPPAPSRGSKGARARAHLLQLADLAERKWGNASEAATGIAKAGTDDQELEPRERRRALERIEAAEAKLASVKALARRLAKTNGEGLGGEG